MPAPARPEEWPEDRERDEDQEADHAFEVLWGTAIACLAVEMLPPGEGAQLV
jgi:hypothetical protein